MDLLSDRTNYDLYVLKKGLGFQLFVRCPLFLGLKDTKGVHSVNHFRSTLSSRGP